MKKAIVMMAMTAVFTTAGAGSALAAWNQNEAGWWYQYADGSYPAGGMTQVEGGIYYFNQSGYMQTGWQSMDGKWYYFDGNGTLATGWRQLDGKWYYLDPYRNGAMHTSWMDLGGKRYYFDGNGVMQTGIFFLDDMESGSKYAYMADASGALVRNRTDRNGKSKIKYDEYGRITFRNAKTEEDAKRFGTNVWQPLYSQSQLDEIADEEGTELRVIQNELWEAYEDEVKKVNKKDRAEALEEWKYNVRDELEDYLSSREIEEFINKVISSK